jgi:hypothetical protein
MRPVTVSECVEVISNLNKSYTDENVLPVKICQLLKHILAVPLANHINNSFQSGIFPAIPKKACITPIYKSGARTDTANYRPKSVLPVFSKLFEKCILSRLLSFMEQFSIISPCQFGFRKGMSTVDAVITLTEYIYNSLDSREHSASIFVDLKKAFDTVNHRILLDKLYCYGVRGLTLSWFADYLDNRVQCVKIGASHSDPKIFNIGVPQINILGPILFLICVMTYLRSLLNSRLCYLRTIQLSKFLNGP